MGALIRAIKDLGIEKDAVAVVAGIGCAGRMPVYLDFNTMHTTHGRAPAVATGIKMHRPDMMVIVVCGDGDALAIGGNHFIHAARRNIDINILLVNNGIYGMTGGQTAPTTPSGAFSHTMPWGNIEPPFDAVALACTAGATFAARGTISGIVQTTNYMKRAFSHKGFSLMEVLSPCPTQYGRLNKSGSAADMLRRQKELSISRERAERLTEEQRSGKIITGVFKDEQRAEYTDAYRDYVKRAQKYTQQST
jgi:2-oxoglutarate ferredoxin oxidoreductase subunit beta